MKKNRDGYIFLGLSFFPLPRSSLRSWSSSWSTGKPIHKDYQEGKFSLIESDEMLAELRTMIAETRQIRGLFYTNHASNYLPIRARMPKDKDTTLALIDRALAGNVSLWPEWMRAL